jgi:hypothetical protein
MLHFRSDAEIDHLVRALLECSLPKAAWTHAAHFAAALWLLRYRGLQAMSDMAPLIRAYNDATGVPNSDTSGYHETITLASLRAANAWLKDRPGAELNRLLDELLATPLRRSDWLLTYWSKPVLFSIAARRGWVEPDLQPLPF